MKVMKSSLRMRRLLWDIVRIGRRLIPRMLNILLLRAVAF